MNCDVSLVQKPQVDNDVFLPACKKILGYSPARAADRKHPQPTPGAHYLICISAFKDQDATGSVEEAMRYLDFLHYGFLIIADERDMQELLEATRGMPFVVVETVMRGMQCALVTGSLRTWRTAVRLGCRSEVSQVTRECFDKVYLAFGKIGMKAFFGALTKRQLPDQTFLLEGPDS